MCMLNILTPVLLILSLAGNASAETVAGSGGNYAYPSPNYGSYGYGYQSADSFCSVPSSKFESILKANGQAWQTHTPLTAAMREAEVVIAGEVHLNTSPGAMAEMIRMFQRVKGERACVALELPNKPEGVNGILEWIKKMSAESKGSVDERTGFDDFYDYYAPLASLAQSLGMKVIGVDHPENFEKELSLVERNHVMSANITKAIRSGECKAVLLFVGKAHEAKFEPPRISDLLKKGKMKTVSINIQMTREDQLPLGLRTWPTCSAPSIVKPVVFNNAALNPYLRLIPLSSEKVRWQDFDYTLLVP